MGTVDVVLVVADGDQLERLVKTVRDDPRTSACEIITGLGDDDTIDLAALRRPRAVITQDELTAGDGRALLGALRSISADDDEWPTPWMVLIATSHRFDEVASGRSVADRTVTGDSGDESLLVALLEGLSGEAPDSFAADMPAPREPTVVLSADDVEASPSDTVDNDFDFGAATPPPEDVVDDRPPSGDFARELRKKMSAMASRLFQGEAGQVPTGDELRPAYDPHAEIDLGAFGDEGRSATELDEPAAAIAALPQVTAPARSMSSGGATGSPGSMPGGIDGESQPLVLGEYDVANLLARAIAVAFTGQLELVSGSATRNIFLDQGRVVFASSNVDDDRVGTMLRRAGKITAAQLEQALAVVAETGRRTGEVLVDLGYLKRRELAAAVRLHLENIVYGGFAWRSGTFRWLTSDGAVSERIRITRQPTSLVLEGIRRKFGEDELVQLLGDEDPIITITDRERLATLQSTADVSTAEREILAGLDGERRLSELAQAVGLESANVWALAWSLVVLSVAVQGGEPASRMVVDGEMLVGETDLAIDRERVHARYQLVSVSDYFTLLGVRADASRFEIRRAYEAARRDFAPEHFAPELRRELAAQLEQIAVVLDEAYAVLRSEPLRSQYAAHVETLV